LHISGRTNPKESDSKLRKIAKKAIILRLFKELASQKKQRGGREKKRKLLEEKPKKRLDTISYEWGGKEERMFLSCLL